MSSARRRLRGVIADVMGVSGDQTIYWTPDIPIIYIGNPKAGCSTIKHSLKLAQAAEYSRAGIAFEARAGLPHKADECLKTFGLSRSARSQRFLISCVRNPFTRVLSAYIEKVAERDIREYPGIPKRAKGKEYPELRNRNVSNFEQYLTAIADFKSKRLDPHFRPQNINIDFPNIDYDAIFYLEHLSVLSKFLSGVTTEFNLETFAPHSQSAGSKLRDYYTDRSVKLVQEIYSKDFSLFGYSKNLGDVGMIPGECILGGRIISSDVDVSGIASRGPTHAAPCRAFAATMRYHQLHQMRII